MREKKTQKNRDGSQRNKILRVFPPHFLAGFLGNSEKKSEKNKNFLSPEKREIHDAWNCCGDFCYFMHFFGSPRSRISLRQVEAPSKILSESVRKFKKKQGVSEKNHFEIYYICIYINRLCWQRKKSIHIYMYTSIYISIYIYMYIYIYICI